MDRRLVSSWLTANYMMGENYLDNFKVAGEDRIYPGMVPRNFVARSNPFGSNQAYPQDESTIPYGVMYLKQGIGRESTAAEVFAEFYCDNEEINTARVRTESLYYLPRVKGSSIEIGYGRFLPRFKDNMIQRALALYMITDEDGNPQIDRINDLEVYAPNYLPKLVVPSVWSPP
ncbi:MAG: hypothetical protein Q8Q35_02540 [Nanoarchaeota archaeon]|nr:hypothetical protein [Nanoarchaeota archaeon]